MVDLAMLFLVDLHYLTGFAHREVDLEDDVDKEVVDASQQRRPGR